MEENTITNSKISHDPIDEYKVLNDTVMDAYYDKLKIQIISLASINKLTKHDVTSSIVVNHIWEYKELFPQNDNYLMEISEFLNILLKSISSDESIEIRYGSKKIKIQSELTKNRITYLINTLLVEELRDDFTINPDVAVEKPYRFIKALKEQILNIDPEQPVQSNYHSNIINLSAELLTKDELNAVLDSARKKCSIEEKEKYSKLKRNELKIVINQIIVKLRDIGVFNNNLKTIATNEACFLYDVLVLSNVIELDPFFDKQEKFQYIKRRYL